MVVSLLTEKDLRHFREMLEAERAAIESRLGARNQDIKETVRDEIGAGDPDDEALRLYDREDDIVSNELDEQTLEQVHQALERIDAGTYGVSVVSGKPIPRDRLEAVPYAATLVEEEPNS